MTNLLATKSLDKILVEAMEEGEHTLRRALGPVNLVALGVGAINKVRRHVTWPYVAKLSVYSLVTAATGAYGMVLADYTRFETVNYVRLFHDAGFIFAVTFLAIGAKHLEALHYKRSQQRHSKMAKRTSVTVPGDVGE